MVEHRDTAMELKILTVARKLEDVYFANRRKLEGRSQSGPGDDKDGVPLKNEKPKADCNPDVEPWTKLEGDTTTEA